MINKNLNWKNKNLQASPSKNEPFLLKPAYKDYLWGGRRLNDDFSKGIEAYPLAETWECSTHPDGLSIVDSGGYRGRTLLEVLKENPSFLGSDVQTGGELPILIKLIDAAKDLSVQVHPDDEYAYRYENGSQGKTEMWYVLDAKKNSRLIYGFHTEVTKQQIRESIENKRIEKYLQKKKIEKDDVFFIKAGTVHAIGAGSLIAEIQQSSNLTYRLYDYNRVDKDGKLRELHIEKALDVADMSAQKEPVQPMRVLKYRRGCASELLCRCKYFQVERLLINTERNRQMAEFQSGSDSFQSLLCIDGCGVLIFGEEKYIHFFKGDCIFVPASSVLMKIHGKLQMLKVSC
ncbi:MAG: class I mannose-6-phosphate isomerase [Filifactor alocis]|nr:class I mannose-6-phosphate isomerase [Filifactor alocis]